MTKTMESRIKKKIGTIKECSKTTLSQRTYAVIYATAIDRRLYSCIYIYRHA